MSSLYDNLVNCLGVPTNEAAKIAEAQDKLARPTDGCKLYNEGAHTKSVPNEVFETYNSWKNECINKGIWNSKYPSKPQRVARMMKNGTTATKGCSGVDLQSGVPKCGCGLISNHSWGTAVDLESTNNKYSCAVGDLARYKKQYYLGDIAIVAAKYNWSWGGKYKDFMHFEYVGGIYGNGKSTNNTYASKTNKESTPAPGSTETSRPGTPLSQQPPEKTIDQLQEETLQLFASISNQLTKGSAEQGFQNKGSDVKELKTAAGKQWEHPV